MITDKTTKKHDIRIGGMIFFSRKFSEIIEQEDLQPKYEMRVLNSKNQIFNDIKFTSLTDFNLFLLSVHYDRITDSTDDKIIVVNLETNEIVFNNSSEDWEVVEE
jgi:hypothetical protein